MFNPTIFVALAVTLAIVGLAAVDWYVWGISANGRLHENRGVRPLTMRELTARLLGGVAATNGEVLMVPPVATPTCAVRDEEHGHHGHGFKQVA